MNTVELYVEALDETETFTQGVIESDLMIFANYVKMYGKGSIEKLLDRKLKGEPWHTIARFRQMVYMTTFKPEKGHTMLFFDFKGNSDSVLDDYSKLKEYEWPVHARDEIAKTAYEIINKPTDKKVILKQENLASLSRGD